MKKPVNKIKNKVDSLNDNQSKSADQLPDATQFQFDKSEVVFDDNVRLTFFEKIKDIYNSLNKQMAALVGSVIGFVLLILITIFLIIYFNNHSYTAKIDIPNAIYLNEETNLSVSAEGRKNLDKAVTTFSIKDGKDSDVLSLINGKIKGQKAVTTIIANQEGEEVIHINSVLGKRTLTDTDVKVFVCPPFNLNLVQGKRIDLVKGSKYSPKIDFGKGACSNNILYSSSNQNVFEVDENGRMTAVNSGAASLIIKKASKKIYVPVYVTDKNVSVDSIYVLPKKLKLNVGKTFRLVVGYEPYNASSQNILFASNDNKVATVSHGGLIEAKSKGISKIVVSTSDGRNTTVLVEVVDDIDNNNNYTAEDISLGKSELNITQGFKEQVLAVVTPVFANNKTLTWKSANNNIARVDSNGYVLGVSEGNTDIVIAINGITKSIKVNVVKLNPPVITPSDEIVSGALHSKPYSIKFSGGATGMIYYYGTSKDNMTNTGTKVTVSQEGVHTYYAKYCTASCEEKCNGEAKEKIPSNCPKNCVSEPIICSPIATYISNLKTIGE